MGIRKWNWHVRARCFLFQYMSRSDFFDLCLLFVYCKREHLYSSIIIEVNWGGLSFCKKKVIHCHWIFYLSVETYIASTLSIIVIIVYLLWRGRLSCRVTFMSSTTYDVPLLLLYFIFYSFLTSTPIAALFVSFGYITPHFFKPNYVR